MEKKNIIIKRYDATVNIYDRIYYDEQVKKYNAVLCCFRIRKKGYILDIGCGTGLFINMIPNFNGFIIGIDSSKNMINKAKQNHTSKILLCADADHLPFVTKIFDYVFSFSVLQNMPDPEKTISEIHRVAKTNSKVAITAIKKIFIRSSLSYILNKNGLLVTKFIDVDDIKDYIAICKNS